MPTCRFHGIAEAWLYEMPPPWAATLNRSPGRAAAATINNHSLPHGSVVMLSSHTEPRSFHARAASDLAKCRASHISPSFRAAYRKPEFGAFRSFQGASQVGIMRSSLAPPDRFDFDLQHGFRALSDHVKTPGSLDLSAIGSRRSPLRVRSCHEHVEIVASRSIWHSGVIPPRSGSRSLTRQT
jgi:hypothetical protein